MKICFIMYPWDRVQPDSDSTLRLIHEAVSREHFVAITTTSRLTIRDNVTSAFCDIITNKINISKNIKSFYQTVEFRRSPLPLSGFDAIFMRDNPPLDNLALNFLDSVRSDTFIMNDIHGLRIANNKLYTVSFQDLAGEFLPATHVSKNRNYLERIFQESEGDKMILKPLAGYGGKGVILVEKSAINSFRSLLDFYIGDEESGSDKYVILQEYVERAEEGDIRILILNGEPLRWLFGDRSP